jgi:hypothetical protein
MKIEHFNAFSPFEIGDKIKRSEDKNYRTIIDIACINYLRNRQTEFLYLLDGDSHYQKIDLEHQ